jgi:hypothetical protein
MSTYGVGNERKIIDKKSLKFEEKKSLKNFKKPKQNKKTWT